MGAKDKDYKTGTNWTAGGVEQNPTGLALVLLAPFIGQWMALFTSAEGPAIPHITPLLAELVANPVEAIKQVGTLAFAVGPTLPALYFLLAFTGVALVLEVVLPGTVQEGPETHTGHVPKYVDNGIHHCLVYSVLFYLGSNLGPGNLYDFGIFFDHFAPAVTILNIFGLLFCLFLYYKGLHFPSTRDCGSSGSFLVDYVWGTELYPRLFGIDIKRFINCRFSMTFWQLAGLSFAYRSYTLHGNVDYGLLLSAISQYLYLVKFFMWEIGYMRSIDIIVDRAGFEIQWGCLVWVPSVYTFHTRFSVLHPSGLSCTAAFIIFFIGFMGVVLNYAADLERQRFREMDGNVKVWGKDPVFIKASYDIVDKNGNSKKRTSLLLASGFWGVARHFHYVFELTAAWSWCILANPMANGAAPLLYAVFLTWLLIHRAKRDELKCQTKYGKDYEKYSELVPYLILPGVY